MTSVTDAPPYLVSSDAIATRPEWAFTRSTAGGDGPPRGQPLLAGHALDEGSSAPWMDAPGRPTWRGSTGAEVAGASPSTVVWGPTRLRGDGDPCWRTSSGSQSTTTRAPPPSRATAKQPARLVGRTVSRSRSNLRSAARGGTTRAARLRARPCRLRTQCGVCSTCGPRFRASDVWLARFGARRVKASRYRGENRNAPTVR